MSFSVFQLFRWCVDELTVLAGLRNTKYCGQLRGRDRKDFEKKVKMVSLIKKQKKASNAFC